MDERAPDLRDLEAMWSPGHDPVETFAASMEMALRDLRAEVASLRSERDELRREVEALRSRGSLEESLRELRELTSTLRTAPAAAVPLVVDRPFTIAWDVPAGPPPGERARRRRRNRIRRLVLWSLGAVLVLVSLAVTIGPLVLPYRTYHVRSGSMAPSIPTGALVVLTEVDADDVDVGDVITFDRPDGSGSTVTHRVVALEDGAFVTKGDANDVADPWLVPADGTQWRYAFDVPVVGGAFGWLSTTTARVALVLVALLIVVGVRWSDRRQAYVR